MRRATAVAGIAALAILGTAWSASARRETPRPCTAIDFEGDRFTVCRATRETVRLRVVESDAAGRPYRSFAALAPALASRRVAFAMNGGMFDDAGRAIGLLIVDGREAHALNRRSGAGNFHMMPNGVFFGDAAGWHVATTDAYAARPRSVAFATQSGPMLLVAGRTNPNITPNGPSRYVRNGVGVDASGTAWFAISEGAVSFGRFARLFRDRLGCPDALYFDGSVSSLWAPSLGRRDGRAALGPIVVAEQAR